MPWKGRADGCPMHTSPSRPGPSDALDGPHCAAGKQNGGPVPPLAHLDASSSLAHPDVVALPSAQHVKLRRAAPVSTPRRVAVVYGGGRSVRSTCTARRGGSCRLAAGVGCGGGWWGSGEVHVVRVRVRVRACVRACVRVRVGKADGVGSAAAGRAGSRCVKADVPWALHSRCALAPPAPRQQRRQPAHRGPCRRRGLGARGRGRGAPERDTQWCM
jgi:hypothetical protein